MSRDVRAAKHALFGIAIFSQTGSSWADILASRKRALFFRAGCGAASTLMHAMVCVLIKFDYEPSGAGADTLVLGLVLLRLSDGATSFAKSLVPPLLMPGLNRTIHAARQLSRSSGGR